MSEFEALLTANMSVLKRFVFYKINNVSDAEDIIQDVCFTAFSKYSALREKQLFKVWLIKIATNKCNDYYRNKSILKQIPIEAIRETEIAKDYSQASIDNVQETLEHLSAAYRHILKLFYFNELTQNEIAEKLNIPIGTVKSKLFYAKQRFKELYPYTQTGKGEIKMKQLPDIIPKYTIIKTDKKPFSIKVETLAGWPIIPRLNEKCSMGIYYAPSGKMQGHIEAEVIGEAEIYGIRGVEIKATEYDMEDYYRTEAIKKNERHFIAQLTHTHSRFLAETHIEDGVRRVHTFIDDDEFTENWGYGEDNCGTPIHISKQKLISRKGNRINGILKPEAVDITDRYTVNINGRTYDTVCVMDFNCFNDPVVSEEYFDKNGRSVLFRRFNKNDWAFDRFRKYWTELLPGNETLIVNGEIYVHWYDCITDYIL